MPSSGRKYFKENINIDILTRKYTIFMAPNLSRQQKLQARLNMATTSA